MLYYLHLLKNMDWALAKALNVLRYISVRGAAAALTAFLLSVIIGPWLIRRLRRDKVGEDTCKSDSVELNRLHSGKSGTPTMGGVLMLIAVVCSAMLWARPEASGWAPCAIERASRRPRRHTRNCRRFGMAGGCQRDWP